jgi:hypothetical protein
MNEAIIASEAQLTREKLALENYQLAKVMVQNSPYSNSLHEQIQSINVSSSLGNGLPKIKPVN